ncbi:MAG: hypothetical protein KC457_10380, partial [Myxococcales bacterium]|nr:hypothetical protein [Myxococcales bacterium]
MPTCIIAGVLVVVFAAAALMFRRSLSREREKNGLVEQRATGLAAKVTEFEQQLTRYQSIVDIEAALSATRVQITQEREQAN